MTEQPIIPAVPVDVLKSELTPDRLLRTTNKGGNVIYVVDAKTCPNVMREIGRIISSPDTDGYARQRWEAEAEALRNNYAYLFEPVI